MAEGQVGQAVSSTLTVVANTETQIDTAGMTLKTLPPTHIPVWHRQVPCTQHACSDDAHNARLLAPEHVPLSADHVHHLALFSALLVYNAHLLILEHQLKRSLGDEFPDSVLALVGSSSLVVHLNLHMRPISNVRPE